MSMIVRPYSPSSLYFAFVAKAYTDSSMVMAATAYTSCNFVYSLFVFLK